MFQIVGLPLDKFSPLFDLSDEQLQGRRARRVIATSNPGFPCRVSLRDAEIGEALILVHYIHQDTDSPYRASHAIYVREQAAQATPGPGQIPDVLEKRTLSVRAFTTDGTMHDACVTEGADLASKLKMFFQEPHTEYIDIHNAAPGCFAARAVRVTEIM